MSNYYTCFSFQVPLPNPAAVTYALDLYKRIIDIQTGDQKGTLPEDLDNDDIRDFPVCWDCATDRDGIWLHSTEGGLDTVIPFVQHLLNRFESDEVISFQWSADASKPLLDAYGGGAEVITREESTSMTTGEWLSAELERIEKARNERTLPTGTPGTPGTPNG